MSSHFLNRGVNESSIMPRCHMHCHLHCLWFQNKTITIILPFIINQNQNNINCIFNGFLQAFIRLSFLIKNQSFNQINHWWSYHHALINKVVFSIWFLFYLLGKVLLDNKYFGIWINMKPLWLSKPIIKMFNLLQYMLKVLVNNYLSSHIFTLSTFAWSRKVLVDLCYCPIYFFIIDFPIKL